MARATDYDAVLVPGTTEITFSGPGQAVAVVARVGPGRTGINVTGTTVAPLLKRAGYIQFRSLVMVAAFPRVVWSDPIWFNGTEWLWQRDTPIDMPFKQYGCVVWLSPGPNGRLVIVLDQ